MQPDIRSLSSTERQRELLGWIERKRRARLQEIVDAFRVSPATARRDLHSLADTGKVQRVRGGVLALRSAPPEAPAMERAEEQAQEKHRIADMAASLIHENDTVFLGSGTTVEAVARLLASRNGLTVITNSLLVLNALSSASGVTIVSLGGTLRQTELSFIGSLTQSAVGEWRRIKVVMGIRAIDAEQGLTNADIDECLVDRAIIGIGSDVIIVADHTKCGRISTAFVAPIESITHLVTDTGTAPEFVESLREQGVSVFVV